MADNTPYRTLGILGGGQLGRMSAQAAQNLGVEVVIFTPEEHSPASQVAPKTIVAAYDDQEALREFSEMVEVISYEFENIPVETVRYLKTLKPVYPDENLLEVTQDRINEKTFLNGINIPTARWFYPQKAADISTQLSTWGASACILKTARFGYDGKGQKKLDSPDDINETWRSFNNQKVIMEEIVDFSCEISVVIARDSEGRTSAYGPMLNAHENHILSRTVIPAPISDELATKALAMTERLAVEVDLRGVLALEMFVTTDNRILANEIAPRTHNSGHWTIDACDCSQFEQHVRTVCGFPVGSSARHSDAEMLNLIGEDVEKAAQYEGRPDAHIHLYGKTETRPGRKMGHITITKPLQD